MKLFSRFFVVLFGLALAMCSIAQSQEVSLKPRVIVMLGAPGAGKGTVAVKLSDELALPHISTGDLFRANIGGKTPLGEKAKGYIDRGELVPDELVFDMLFARVQEADCLKGYVLDGFPRTLPQAKALNARLEGKAEVIALNLEVSEDLLVNRIVNRRVCNDCGTPFHLTFKAPQKEGVCDRCSGKLIQRTDDTKEVVLKRLAVYHEQTQPVEAFYREKGCVVSIDGNPDPAAVFKQAKEKLTTRNISSS